MSKPLTNISVVKDLHSSDADILFSSFAAANYNLCFEDLIIKHKDLDSTIAELTALEPSFKLYQFDKTIFNTDYVLESKDFLIVLETFEGKQKISLNIYFQDYKSVKPLFDIILKYADKDDSLFVIIYSFFISNNNIRNIENIKYLADFEQNSENFYPFLDVEEMFNQFIQSDSNILLLCGEPGTGKSKLGDLFMKHVLLKSTLANTETAGDSNDFEYGVKVAYIKNEEILSRDEFWIDIKENEYDLVFLDDLDYGLLPRTQHVASGEELNKNKFISNLLSFTDGIFDAGNKTKFIITSNRPVQDIDSAVIRKGRTFDILELRRLSFQEAKDIWFAYKLSLEMFNHYFGHLTSSDTILQADIGNYIKLHVNKAEEPPKPYLKEPGISIMNKSVDKPKIGL